MTAPSTPSPPHEPIARESLSKATPRTASRTRDFLLCPNAVRVFLETLDELRRRNVLKLDDRESITSALELVRDALKTRVPASSWRDCSLEEAYCQLRRKYAVFMWMLICGGGSPSADNPYLLVATEAQWQKFKLHFRGREQWLPTDGLPDLPYYSKVFYQFDDRTRVHIPGEEELFESKPVSTTPASAIEPCATTLGKRKEPPVSPSAQPEQPGKRALYVPMSSASSQARSASRRLGRTPIKTEKQAPMSRPTHHEQSAQKRLYIPVLDEPSPPTSGSPSCDKTPIKMEKQPQTTSGSAERQSALTSARQTQSQQQTSAQSISEVAGAQETRPNLEGRPLPTSAGIVKALSTLEETMRNGNDARDRVAVSMTRLRGSYDVELAMQDAKHRFGLLGSHMFDFSQIFVANPMLAVIWNQFGDDLEAKIAMLRKFGVEVTES